MLDFINDISFSLLRKILRNNKDILADKRCTNNESVQISKNALRIHKDQIKRMFIFMAYIQWEWSRNKHKMAKQMGKKWQKGGG